MSRPDIDPYPGLLAPYQKLVPNEFDTAITVHTNDRTWPRRTRRITEVVVVASSAHQVATEEATRMRRSRWINTGIIAASLVLAQATIWLIAWRVDTLTGADVDPWVITMLAVASVVLAGVMAPRAMHQLDGTSITDVLSTDRAVALSQTLGPVSRDRVLHAADFDVAALEEELARISTDPDL